MNMSYWFDAVPATPQFTVLIGKKDTDVLVIGGGITGLLTAYLLVNEGKRVIVLEKGMIGAGESGFTTAFLTQVTDTSLQKLHGTFGDEGAKLAWQSGAESIDLLESIIQTEGIACDFQRCSVFVSAATDAEWDELKKEQKLAQEMGFSVSETSEVMPWPSEHALEIPNQAIFHPRKFLRGLVECIIRRGGIVCEQSPVVEFDPQNPHRVLTAQGEVIAGKIVVATHSPIDNPLEGPGRLTAYQSYVVAARVPRGTIPRAMFLDSQYPYHYLRSQPDGEHEVIILGGEDRETGDVSNTDERFQALETFLRTQILKDLTHFVTYRWSGQILQTPDGFPFIGHSLFHPDRFIATGYAGNGLTFGAVAAKLISDLILDRPNVYQKLYSPQRVKGILSLIKSGVRIGGHFLRDRLFPEKQTEVTDLKPGEGRVIEQNGKRIAVSIAADGTCKACSAICTHLGCVVGWNGAEKTWDCPCHGSRFDPQGKVISGPATTPLSPEKLD